VLFLPLDLTGRLCCRPNFSLLKGAFAQRASRKTKLPKLMQAICGPSCHSAKLACPSIE